MEKRIASIQRKTKETDIKLELCLDGTGQVDISTGYGFADHMLTLLAFWSGWDLEVSCNGDTYVDAHHSLEDIGLCLGQALRDALGAKTGIARVGNAKVPMDEALAEAVVDISGRPYLVYNDAPVPAVVAGEEKDLWREFFKSLAFKAGMNIHLAMPYGQNGHHLLEAACKALGLALRQAAKIDRDGVLSTKGSLDQ